MPLEIGGVSVPVFHHTSGCLAAQPPSASNSAVSEISSGSLLAGPISCTPIGKPSEVKPAGTLIDGHPNIFHGQVTGQAAIIVRSVPNPPNLSNACAGGGGCAVVGATTTSTMRKIDAHPALIGGFVRSGGTQYRLREQPSHPHIRQRARVQLDAVTQPLGPVE